MKKLLLIITIALFTFTAKAQDALNSSGNNFTEITQVKIYPNPVTDMTFKMTSDIDIAKIEILNVIGQKVQTIEDQQISETTTVNLTACERGVYLVKVLFTNNKTLIKKILVK